MKKVSFEEVFCKVLSLEKLSQIASKTIKDFNKENVENGVIGAVMVVFSEAGPTYAVSYDKDRFSRDDVMQALNDQVKQIENDSRDKNNSEVRDPLETPMGKMALAMFMSGGLTEDGHLKGKLIRKACIKMAQNPKQHSNMTKIDRYKFINELFGSPLSEEEISALVEELEKENDN